MDAERLPWEVVETLPRSDAAELTRFDADHDDVDPSVAVPALVGSSLLRYWAPALGVVDTSIASTRDRRFKDLERALTMARTTDNADLLATALLGGLYASWGPTQLDERAPVLDELATLRTRVSDQELRVRITEWQVLDGFDRGDLPTVRARIADFMREAEGVDSKLFTRREVLWRANLEMLEGRIDRSVELNEEAIASTADLAGSPFSFQNVAITTAIAMYFRRGLGGLIDAIRSIRASSPRVESNWEIGLTFALSESGEHEEARERFEQLAADRFAVLPRDLNWLVSMQLLGLVAVNLSDRDQAVVVHDLLCPYAGLDATHGSGYASYGPVDRTLGLLAETIGRTSEAATWFDAVVTSRAPGPWTTLALADRARVQRAAAPAAALVDAIRAEAELRAFGLDARAAEMHEFVASLRVEGEGGPIARRQGDVWTLRHPSGVIDAADSTGMRHLVELLRRPGEPFDVLDLDTKIGPHLPRSSVVESTLDPTAQAAYRRRLHELDNRLTPSVEEQREADLLRRELTGARYVSAGALEIERARVRVTKAIRRTIDKVEASAPGLGFHLRGSISTGRRCSYDPIDGVGWLVEH